MIIHFYLRFHTRFGQNIFVTGNIEAIGNGDPVEAFALSYLDKESWYGTIQVKDTKEPVKLRYRYLLREEGSVDVLDAENDRIIDISVSSANEVTVIDTWNAEGDFENIFYTKPFRDVLLSRERTIPALKEPRSCTHQFKVKAPLVNAGEWVCITGEGKTFRNWDVNKLLPLKKEGDWFTIKVNLAKGDFPLKYKYGVYDIKRKTFVYEEGADRQLQTSVFGKQAVILHDGFLRLQRKWKGAGVAIPVFSLRTNRGFGTGEFNDIKLLADWAKQSGIKLLQFLPVNDTTATFTAKDSYPYSGISSLALHPLYINLESVAGTHHASLVKRFSKRKKSLDQLSYLDYESVVKFKLSALKELYHAQKDAFLSDKNYFDFFECNREWLAPYAAFCFLRDKYGTADFSQWRSNKVYNRENIQKLVLPSQSHYDDICFHYFVQYHLHLQLKESCEYAHQKGIVCKGDIPIGVSRHSCDVWLDPLLFNVGEQAGAPPDPFAVKGQNWGFPTYNWKKMKEDDYAWWRKRFAQMNNYFDAFRIDHILGFFRIWSIPIDAVEGIMGRFVPAIPVHVSEFARNHIWFDEDRYCKPYITDEILISYFAEKTSTVKEIFLIEKENGDYLLKEAFDTQVKIEEYFQENGGEPDDMKHGLFDLLSNTILIPENGTNMQQFHFRISMQQTRSFQQLDPYTRQQLSELYNDYFYRRQDGLWKAEALQKLPALKHSTDMLVCGEDLGMVPACVPEVMKQTGVISLEIQRMPKDPFVDFFHPKNAPYLSIVTPSTHDMSTLRGWWLEDEDVTQRFYNDVMGRYGKVPAACEPGSNREIIMQHVYSPAMWSIFQLQDLLGMSEELRREDPSEERINQPANPEHQWKYRMHLTLEVLIRQKDFSKELKTLFTESGRA